MIFRIWRICTKNDMILSYPFHRLQNLLDYSLNMEYIYNIYICRPKQKPCFALKYIWPNRFVFFSRTPTASWRFFRHFWLARKLKEMTLNIVKGFLPPLISCCNNGAVPLSDFFIYVFLFFVCFFQNDFLWLIVTPHVKRHMVHRVAAHVCSHWNCSGL